MRCKVLLMPLHIFGTLDLLGFVYLSGPYGLDTTCSRAFPKVIANPFTLYYHNFLGLHPKPTELQNLSTNPLNISRLNFEEYDSQIAAPIKNARNMTTN